MLQNERRSDERLTEMRAIARAAAFSRALEGEGFRRQTFRVFRRVRRGPSKLSEVWCVDDIVGKYLHTDLSMSIGNCVFGLYTDTWNGPDVDTGVVSRVIDRSKALLLPFVTAASKIVGLIAGLMNWLVDL